MNENGLNTIPANLTENGATMAQTATRAFADERRAARNTAGLLEELEAVHAEVGFHAVKTALYHADDRVEALALLAHFGSLDNNVSVNVGVGLGVNDLDGHFAFPLLLLEHGFLQGTPPDKYPSRRR